MHLSGGFSLKSYLQEIGLKNIFNSQISDLSLMTSSNSGSNQRNQQQNSNRYNSRQKRDLSYKSESENFRSDKKRLRLKDFVLYKRITKSNPGKKYRNKRQADQYQPLKNLHTKRRTNLRNPGWFADDVLHKVDLTINERGTEGGAATGSYLNDIKLFFKVFIIFKNFSNNFDKIGNQRNF